MKKINFQNGTSGETPLNKTNMNLLQTNIEDEFKKLLNALSNNKATVTGETIDIRDSAEERVYEFNISGNSKQETMPSPENPSEIKNVTGNANITVCNKNFLDHNLALYTGNYNSNGEHIVNTDMCIKDYIFLKASTYVAIAQNNTWINVNVYDLEKKFIKSHNSQTNKKVKFTLEKDSFIRIAFNPIVPSLSDFMIIKESSTEDWLEHQSLNISFPLSEGQRLYKDSYLADDGIHHKRGQYQFTGNETLLTDLERTNTRRYYTSTKVVAAKSILAISNRFIQANSATDLNNNDNEKILILNGGQFAFRLNKTTADGVTAVKQWLSENLVIVEYELAEEVIEPYTEEQLKVYSKIKNELKTYKGITHIYSTDETSPIVEVRYIKDIEIMMNN